MYSGKKDMFKASPYSTAVLSKSTIVPSDHQQVYNDGDTMRFEVPSFMSYIDPRQSYLKFKLSIKESATTNHLRLKLDPSVGAQGVIDRIRIYDGNNQVQLENLENYAERIAITNHYTENQSILAKRELLEGVETSTTFENGQLFNSYGENATITSSVNMNGNSLEIAMPLHSGVLGGQKLFPVELFDGLRIEMDLNPAGKYLRNFSPAGLATDVGGLPFANGEAIVTGTPSNLVKVFGDSVFGDTAVQYADGTNWASNVRVGDTLSGVVADGTTEVLGVVAQIETIAQVAPFTSDHIQFTLVAPYAPPAAGKNLPVWTTGTDPLGQVFVSTAQYNNNVPRVVIEDVELVLKQVTPPAGLVADYTRAIQTEAGVQLDIMTYETYRNNIPATESVWQVQVPSYNSRAKAVLCLPMNNQLSQNLTTNNLGTILDNITQYQFYINGQPQPTRAVNVADLSKTIPTASQVALWELEKSLATCGLSVRKLVEPQDHFAVARPFARYGGVYNLKDVGGFALKQEYNGSATNKLLLSFVGSLRRLIVNASGKIVEL